jgi:hypothetical protein
LESHDHGSHSKNYKKGTWNRQKGTQKEGKEGGMGSPTQILKVDFSA